MRFLLILCSAACLFAQTSHIVSGRRYPRLVVRNATIIEGNGTPASGPKDIILEQGRIVDIVALDPVALSRGTSRRPAGDVEIDAKGKYACPVSLMCMPRFRMSAAESRSWSTTN
jgi:hypothetical protein